MARNIKVVVKESKGNIAKSTANKLSAAASKRKRDKKGRFTSSGGIRG